MALTIPDAGCNGMSMKPLSALEGGGFTYGGPSISAANLSIARRNANAATAAHAGLPNLGWGQSALTGVETFRTFRKWQFENCEIGVANEIGFLAKLFPNAA